MRISIDEPQIEVVKKTEAVMEREAVRKTFRGEMKKLKAMNMSDRVKYLWGYYKLHAFVILLAVVITVYMINFFLTRKECVLMGVAINDTYLNVSVFEKDLAEYLSLKNDQEVSLIESVDLTYNATSGTTSSHYTGQTQLLAYIMAKQLDFAFGNQDGMEYLASTGVCRLIEDIFPDDIYAAFQNRIVRFSIRNDSSDKENGEPQEIMLPIALDVTGTKIAEYFGFHGEHTYLCFTALSGYDEELQGFVRFLYELEFGQT